MRVQWVALQQTFVASNQIHLLWLPDIMQLDSETCSMSLCNKNMTKGSNDLSTIIDEVRQIELWKLNS